MAHTPENVPLETQLEEAERKGREKGMADMFAALSAADAAENQRCVFRDCYHSNADYFQARLDIAMMAAVKQNKRELILFFLEAGSSVDTYHENGLTALEYAVQEGNTELVNTFLEAGADPNESPDGIETLHKKAVAQEDVELVRALLKAGPPVSNYFIRGKGEWLIDYSVEGDHAEMTEILIKAGASIKADEVNARRTPLMLAAASGKATAAALLIEAGCAVNCRDRNGETALIIAAEAYEADKEDVLDTIRLLLNSGAEVNAKCGYSGRTALIYAAGGWGEGSLEAVRMLLAAGADVFTRVQCEFMVIEPPDDYIEVLNAFEMADDDAIKEIIKSEMHRRIAVALLVLPTLPLEVRQKIIQLYVEDLYEGEEEEQ